MLPLGLRAEDNCPNAGSNMKVVDPKPKASFRGENPLLLY